MKERSNKVRSLSMLLIHYLLGKGNLVLLKSQLMKATERAEQISGAYCISGLECKRTLSGLSKT